MENQQFNKETERLFVLLQERLQALAQRCEHLQEEKQVMQNEIDELRDQCRVLAEQHQRARTRIEAMVARFNGLEQA